MTRTHSDTNPRGQVYVLFVLAFVVLVAMAGLLVDGGRAWVDRRQAQSAADTAALAAAQAIGSAPSDNSVGQSLAVAGAQPIAAANGFATGNVSCPGGTAVSGVQVHYPPSSGPHAGASGYVEVIVTRPMTTSFAAAVGQPCWLVSARAVAALTDTTLPCHFCSLNNTTANHTLILKSGARLRVDGDIHADTVNGCVNRSTVNGLLQCNDGATCALTTLKACGDGFDVQGTNGSISARTISVVGGWEVKATNTAAADLLATPGQPDCAYHPNPTAIGVDAKVCIHVTPFADPFKDLGPPQAADYAIPTASSCAALPGTSGVKAGSSSAITSVTSGVWTLCPGKYYGIAASGAGSKIVLQSGVYYLTNKGLSVANGGSIDGSSGVLIYNAYKDKASLVTISQFAEGSDTLIDPDLIDLATSYPGSPLPVNPTLVADHNPRTVKTDGTVSNVTYTFKGSLINKTTKISGTVHFYDGDVQLDGDPAYPQCVTDTFVAAGNLNSTCQIPYTVTDVGTHGISAVFFSSNGVYNSVQASLDEVITTGGTLGGTTILTPMTSGPFAGFIIWQDKLNPQTITLSPQSALAACDTFSATWMTDGTPGHGGSVPPPCGPMGGIEGTIYAPNATATVLFTGSGVADLQVVSGKISLTSPVDARFAYTPGKFAGGGVHLVE